MTAKKTGILIHFDEIRRRELILERVDGIYESFSDALSVQDWAIGQLSIALIGILLRSTMLENSTRDFEVTTRFPFFANAI